MFRGNPATSSAASFFVRADYRARALPAYFTDEPAQRVGQVWQPDVYPIAARVAERYGARHLVDVGCGDAQKLVALRGRFDLCGIDFGANIQACRRRYDFGTWIEHDLDADVPLPLPGDVAAGSVVICSDVVEHVRHPDRLLLNLRAALERAYAVVISTPERDLTRGSGDLGPPQNPAHVREWTLEEFAAFLGWAGFTEGRVGLTRSSNRHGGRHTILAVLEQERSAGGTLRVASGQKRVAALRRRCVLAARAIAGMH